MKSPSSHVITLHRLLNEWNKQIRTAAFGNCCLMTSLSPICLQSQLKNTFPVVFGSLHHQCYAITLFCHQQADSHYLTLTIKILAEYQIEWGILAPAICKHKSSGYALQPFFIHWSWKKMPFKFHLLLQYTSTETPASKTTYVAVPGRNRRLFRTLIL